MVVPPASLPWTAQMGTPGPGLAGTGRCGSWRCKLAQVLPNSQLQSFRPCFPGEGEVADSARAAWCLQCHCLSSQVCVSQLKLQVSQSIASSLLTKQATSRKRSWSVSCPRRRGVLRWEQSTSFPASSPSACGQGVGQHEGVCPMRAGLAPGRSACYSWGSCSCGHFAPGPS